MRTYSSSRTRLFPAPAQGTTARSLRRTGKGQRVLRPLEAEPERVWGSEFNGHGHAREDADAKEDDAPTKPKPNRLHPRARRRPRPHRRIALVPLPLPLPPPLRHPRPTLYLQLHRSRAPPQRAPTPSRAHRPAPSRAAASRLPRPSSPFPLPLGQSKTVFHVEGYAMSQVLEVFQPFFKLELTAAHPLQVRGSGASMPRQCRVNTASVTRHSHQRRGTTLLVTRLLHWIPTMPSDHRNPNISGQSKQDPTLNQGFGLGNHSLYLLCAASNISYLRGTATSILRQRASLSRLCTLVPSGFLQTIPSNNLRCSYFCVGVEQSDLKFKLLALPKFRMV
ncbi:hypothetical protein K438DRAFT_1764453 [Mycena galopus ATCC 62051]|nr:hypothetical protein K438DRAFT_1764453 [Mycena galopus ATCC 62051]